MSQADASVSRSTRIPSLDQLRGYAIFGMLLVNSKGLFGVEIDQLKHHRDYFTYADTIAPLFVFVVGMTMRLAWLRNSERLGAKPARAALFRRFGLMALIAFAVYAGWLWDALMDIGLAGLLALPLIGKRPRVRIAAAFGMVAIYQAVAMLTIYGPWITRTVKLDESNMPLWIRLIPLRDALFDVPINGGPLGPLSWCMMLLLGTVAYDWLTQGSARRFALACMGWGSALCAAGYALSAAWPGAKPVWPISAYYMTAPFPLWATGLCLWHLLAFYVLCDRLGLRIPTFTEVGMNPLVIYIAQLLVLDVAEGFDPLQLPLAAGLAGMLLLYGVFAALAYYLKRRNVLIRI
jgi:predicted acyltransferase